MGDKVLAREIARACDIPIIPGTDGPLQDLQQAYDFVARLVKILRAVQVLGR